MLAVAIQIRRIKAIATDTTVWEEVGVTEEGGRAITAERTIDAPADAGAAAALAGDSNIITVRIAAVVEIQMRLVMLGVKVPAVWMVVLLLVAMRARLKITKRAKSRHQRQPSKVHERPDRKSVV